MGVPVAVAPSVKSPGLYIDVNLLAGTSSPGTAPKKALLMAPKSTSGTITADTELIESVAGPDDVKTYLGIGTLGHLSAIALFAEYGIAQVDLISPTESTGNAATQTITFASGAPTVSWVVTLWVAGREISFVWAAGETDTQGGDTCADAINEYGGGILPVTAANAIGVVTLTFKTKGVEGNDCTLRVEAVDGVTGTVTAGGATLSGGTLEPDFSTALGNVATKEYDLIIGCVSNGDVQVGSSSTNAGRIKTHISTYNTGRGAKLQQAVIGATGALATIKTGTGALNYGPVQVPFCLAGESLPAEWAGAEAGARLREESADPAVNRIEMAYRATLYGPADLNADAPTPVEVEDALSTGVSIVDYDASNNPLPARPITTYHKDTGANPDYRLLDTSRVTGTYAVAKDLRIALPQEFPNAKLSEDLDVGEDLLPAGVIEVRDVRSFVDQRMRFWVRQGVVKATEWLEAVSNGSFICRVNPSDESQCDLVIPEQIVPPLAKFSVVVQHTGS